MVDYQEIFSELKIWEERFAEDLWQIAIAIRDQAVRLNQKGYAGAAHLPEVSRNDDDGNGVAFWWDNPLPAGGPDFVWIEVRLACGKLHGTEDGYNIIVKASAPDGEIYNLIPNNFTRECWKTGWGDLEEVVVGLIANADTIVHGILREATLWERRK